MDESLACDLGEYKEIPQLKIFEFQLTDQTSFLQGTQPRLPRRVSFDPSCDCRSMF